MNKNLIFDSIFGIDNTYTRLLNAMFYDFNATMKWNSPSEIRIVIPKANINLLKKYISENKYEEYLGIIKLFDDMSPYITYLIRLNEKGIKEYDKLTVLFKLRGLLE